MRTVYLGLGSNLGDRWALLRAAVAALPPHVVVERVSSVYDTAPQLVEDQPRFLNAAVAGATALAPLDLLRAVKAIERRLGRIPGPRFGPRALDIDLLLMDDLVLSTPELTLPHPRLAERAFALIPLAEIAPDLRHPVLGLPVSVLAAQAPTDDVRRLGPLVSSTTIPYNGGDQGSNTES
jgi:2-amino-4-hydroxy-6-hydroxymethyldihydropteridine diphosphokinase